MEFSLHRQLKSIYAADDAQQEAVLGKYRIDVMEGSRLIEIQHGSLAAIRDKVRHLTKSHWMQVVKPLVASKMIVRQDQRDGVEITRRRSPKRGKLLDLFDELVYFTRVFPHPNLEIEVPIVDIEEFRYPGHGRRRRRREKDFQIADQRLVSIQETYRFRTARDLLHVVEGPLPRNFHTGHLAELADVPRWTAQRVAYCWREMGAIEIVGKQGNAILYRMPRCKRSIRRITIN